MSITVWKAVWVQEGSPAVRYQKSVKREGVKEGENDDDVHELPWVKYGECEGDWLVDWRNETGSWFQRCGDAKRNERFVIFKEDEDGREKVTEEEERVLRGGW